jgi:hypothetical protein
MKSKTEENEDIVVQLLDINGDVTEYNDVNFIKIISKKYNLIIMRDYLPIIGEVEGLIEIERKNETITMEKVKGYFMHKHNKFNLFYFSQKSNI